MAGAIINITSTDGSVLKGKEKDTGVWEQKHVSFSQQKISLFCKWSEPCHMITLSWKSKYVTIDLSQLIWNSYDSTAGTGTQLL
jgi:hypothetical protein